MWVRKIAKTDGLYVVYYPKGVVRVMVVLHPLVNGENKGAMSELLKGILRCKHQK
mgnify:CR=1 FL=1